MAIINNEVLLQQLTELQQTGAPAALFVDQQGLDNENGIITRITGVGEDAVVEMDGDRQFPISTIMAVNGLFRTGFSTC